MEVDHVAYIFGSFSRRRESQDVSAAKRRSLMQGPTTSSPRRILLADSSSKFLCPRCKREFKEPRVLPCLHTFCTACLHEVYSCQGSSEVSRAGDTGYKTELGITGDTGYKTELGITGETELGITGYTGYKTELGDIGYKTELGITGDTGYKTELGIVGDTGYKTQLDTGYKTELGITGDTGYKTELGITGDTGYKTELVITGDTGYKTTRYNRRYWLKYRARIEISEPSFLNSFLFVCMCSTALLFLLRGWLRTVSTSSEARALTSSRNSGFELRHHSHESPVMYLLYLGSLSYVSSPCRRSSASSAGSGGSGYGSSEGSWRGRTLTCPTCEAENKLPPRGILGLPPDYVLQHRLVLASLNKDINQLLCDLCTTDSPASVRCTDCLTNLCVFCCEAHQRQRVTACHEVLPIHEARQRGISRLRRQAMCPSHPDQELELFCGPCCQVICQECCLDTHKGHLCEPASRVAHVYTSRVKEAVERARPLAEQALVSLERLKVMEHRIEVRCNQVQGEVQKFLELYMSALEEHGRSLHLQVQQARESKLQTLHSQQVNLQRCGEDARTAVKFAEDLLTDGSQIELLSFVGPILHRLDWCLGKKKGPESDGLIEARESDCIQFLPGERAGIIDSFTLYGVVTTQTVSPQHCIFNTDSEYQHCEAKS
uniref:Uncharacterized protein n=1 Tax=Timema tahoe TaxID=61484 RepID=A0A7R9ISD7_9NEOP|nr:unnamed protein product [Timema tahoe]